MKIILKVILLLILTIVLNASYLMDELKKKQAREDKILKDNFIAGLDTRASDNLDSLRSEDLNKHRQDRYKDIAVDSDGNVKNDGEFVTWAKSLAGMNVYKDGVEVSSDNKDFSVIGKKSLDDIIQEYHDAPEDPNAKGLIYTLKVFDGYNEDGSKRYLYRNSYAKVSVWDRDKYQLVGKNAEIVSEKRFIGAEQWEKEFNALSIKDRALDLGQDKKSGMIFNSDYTELKKHDLLGVDK